MAAVRITPCYAEKIFDVEAGVLYDSNVPRASSSEDIASDTAASVRISGGWREQVGDRSSVSASAFARGAKFARFQGLDAAELGGVLSTRRKLGLGPFAPWASVSGALAAESYRETLRNRVRSSLELRAGRRLTERLELSGGLALERYRASHTQGRLPGYSGDVFGGGARTFFARGDYALDARWLAYAGASYRRGDFVASTRPDPEILEYSRAVRRDPAFGPDYVAYRLTGKTTTLTLGVNRAVTGHSSFDLSLARASTRSDSDIAYGTSQVSLAYVYSY